VRLFVVCVPSPFLYLYTSGRNRKSNSSVKSDQFWHQMSRFC
jgi:hypothetical protein